MNVKPLVDLNPADILSINLLKNKPVLFSRSKSEIVGLAGSQVEAYYKGNSAHVSFTAVLKVPQCESIGRIVIERRIRPGAAGHKNKLTAGSGPGRAGGPYRIPIESQFIVGRCQ